MSVPQSTKSEDSAPQAKCAWEPPAFTELKITETRSNRGRGQTSRSPQPLPPTAPATKLGFSVEAAFPMSSRTESK